MNQPQDLFDEADSWRDDPEYASWLALFNQEQAIAEAERDMEPHKRSDYAERMADAADFARDQARDDAAMQWAISTGAK